MSAKRDERIESTVIEMTKEMADMFLDEAEIREERATTATRKGGTQDDEAALAARSTRVHEEIDIVTEEASHDNVTTLAPTPNGTEGESDTETIVAAKIDHVIGELVTSQETASIVTNLEIELTNKEIDITIDVDPGHEEEIDFLQKARTEIAIIVTRRAARRAAED